MKRLHYVLIAIALIIGAIVIKKIRHSKTETAPLDYTVEKGKLDFYVYATGNLEAEQSTNVDAPKSVFNRELRIYEIAITELVAEGTLVDSGDYIASLDQNLVQENLTKAEEEMELAYNSYLDAQMDSNLTLNNSRDAIITAEESVEERELILAESKYESPATIQKSKMDKEKALRKLAQEKQSYELQKRKSSTQVKQQEIDYQRKKMRVESLIAVKNDIIITAPQKGMVIYYNTRRSVRTVGSTVSSYSPTIATLPDMSTMISVAYVNEIDVSHVKANQSVKLSVDAFPNKILEGKVVSIANIGKVVSGSDAKVFEVIIKVLSSDKELRPAMTTNNTILTASHEDVVIVPTETIFSNDTLNYVFNTNKRMTKQVVRLGDQNENFTIIEEGVKEGDRLLWVSPENEEELDIVGLDIYEKEKADKETALQKSQEEAERMSKEASKSNTSRGNKTGGSDMMIIF